MAMELMPASKFLDAVDSVQEKRLSALENGRHADYVRLTKEYEGLRNRNASLFDQIETDVRVAQEAGLPVNARFTSQFTESQFQRRVAARGLSTDPYQSPRFKEYWMAHRGAGQEAAEVLAEGTRSPDQLAGEKKDKYDVYVAAISENIAPTESLGQFYKTAKGALTGRTIQMPAGLSEDQITDFKSQDEAATRSATLALYRSFDGDTQQAQRFLNGLGSYVPRSPTAPSLDKVVDLGYSVKAATRAVGPQAFYEALNSLSTADKQKVVDDAGGDPAALVGLAKELAAVPTATEFGSLAAMTSVPGATTPTIADPKALVDLRRSEVLAKRGLGGYSAAEAMKNLQTIRGALELEKSGYAFMQEGKNQEALAYILQARIDMYNAQNALNPKKNVNGTVIDGAGAYAGEGISRETVLNMQKHLAAVRDARAEPRIDFSGYFELADDLSLTADKMVAATTPIDVVTPAAENAGYASAAEFAEQVFPGVTGDLVAPAAVLQSRGRVLKTALKKAPILPSDVEANRSTLDDAIRNVGTLILSGAPEEQDALVLAPQLEPKPGSTIRRVLSPMWPQVSQVVSDEARKAGAVPGVRARDVTPAEAWAAGAKALEMTFGSLEAAFYKDDKGVIRMQDRRAPGGTIRIAGKAVPVAPTNQDDKTLLGAYTLGLSDSGLRALAQQQAERAERASKISESRKWLKENRDTVHQMAMKLGVVSQAQLNSMPLPERVRTQNVRATTARSLDGLSQAVGAPITAANAQPPAAARRTNQPGSQVLP